MKLLAFLLTFSAFSFANPYVWISGYGGSSTISTSYQSTAQLTGPSNKFVQVDISNPTSGTLAVNCTSLTVPAVAAPEEMQIPPYSSFENPYPPALSIPFGNSCWVRAVSSSITSTAVSIIGWGY